MVLFSRFACLSVGSMIICMVTQLTYQHSMCEKNEKDFGPVAAQCWVIWQCDKDIFFKKIISALIQALLTENYWLRL